MPRGRCLGLRRVADVEELLVGLAGGGGPGSVGDEGGGEFGEGGAGEVGEMVGGGEAIFFGFQWISMPVWLSAAKTV